MATGIIQSETVKLRVMASASGVICSAEYQAHMAKTPMPARTAKRRKRRRSKLPKPVRAMKGTRIRVPTALRMKAISNTGISAETWRIAADMPAKQAQVKTIRRTPSQVRPAMRLPARSTDPVLMAGGLLPVAARPAPRGRTQAADALARSTMP